MKIAFTIFMLAASLAVLVICVAIAAIAYDSIKDRRKDGSDE